MTTTTASSSTTQRTPAASKPNPSPSPSPGAPPTAASANEQRWARKLERAADLDHLLLWLRTPDTQVMRSMLYPLDRSCAKIRSTAASLLLSLPVAQEALAKVQSWLDQLEGLTASNGAAHALPFGPGAQPETPLSLREKHAWREYRRAIAGQYGVDFYLPRSPEGRRFALALSALDAAIIHARSVDTLEQAGQLLECVGRLIREGHELTGELAQLAKLDYQPHPLLKRAIKHESSLVNSIIADAERSEPTADAPASRDARTATAKAR